MTEPVVSIERLYDIMKQIDENKKAGNSTENVALFKEIVASTGAASGGDSRTKRLASQFIARLFKDFPAEQAAAYEAMVDLLEAEDPAVRKQVVSDLPKLCKDAAEFVPKVADMLVQMLQTDDSQELSLVNQALMQTLSGHPTDALTGLFDQLAHDEVADLTRQRALRFLEFKLPHLSLTPEQEELLVQLMDRLLDDVSQEEFACVVRILASLPRMARVAPAGRQRLVDIVCQQIDLTAAAEFKPASQADVARAIEVARVAVANMTRGCNAKVLLEYFLDKVLPAINQVPDETQPESPRLELLRCLAELSCFGGSAFVATDKHLDALLSLVSTALPPVPPTPPASPKDTADSSTKPEEGEIEAPQADEPEWNFSLLECLLFAVLRLSCSYNSNSSGAGSGQSLASIANSERFEALVERVKFCHQASQVYGRAIRSSMADASSVVATDSAAAASSDATNSTEKQQQQQQQQLKSSLPTIENVARLCRDLLPALSTSSSSSGSSASTSRGVAADAAAALLSWRLQRRLPPLAGSASTSSLNSSDEAAKIGRRRRSDQQPPRFSKAPRRDRDRDRDRDRFYDGNWGGGGRRVRGLRGQRW